MATAEKRHGEEEPGARSRKRSRAERRRRQQQQQQQQHHPPQQHHHHHHQQSLPMPALDDTAYRILCPASKIGSIIGREGSIIKSIRRETHARIKVTDSIPGIAERVVLIWSSTQDLLRARGRRRSAGKDRPEKAQRPEDDGNADGDEEDEWGGGERDGAAEESGREYEYVCPAQHALLKVHDRIIEPEEEEKEIDPLQQVIARFLVPNFQVGCLLGKGGKIIQQMRHQTGAQIRILPKDLLPGCALPSDELVQVSGDLAVVRKALFEISSRIHENPPRERPQIPASLFPSAPSLLSFQSHALQRNMDMFLGNASVVGGCNVPPFGMPPLPSNFGAFGGVEPGYPWLSGSPSFPISPHPGAHAEFKDQITEQEFSIRLLCPDDKIGNIIGKGGNAIRHLAEATRAHINVEESVPECNEKVIFIAATEHLTDAISPVIEAALQLQTQTSDTGPGKEGLITTRLLVPSKNIGCLLGRKGNVITEMRKKTSATIKVLTRADLPRCAQESDELVQVIGNVMIARIAFIEILTRLRNNVFKDQFGDENKFSASPLPPFPSYPLQAGNDGPPADFHGRHESPSHSHLFNGFGMQGGSMLPARPPLLPRFYGDVGPGIMGSGALEPPQITPSTHGTSFHGGATGGYENIGAAYPDNPAGGSSLNDGLLKEISAAIINITIPGPAVSSVLDDDCINISKIHQISGAKLKILDPMPGCRDRVIEISGTPEQTEAAQSLVRAFILSVQTS